MAKVKVVPNKRGYARIRKGNSVKRLVEELAEKIAAQANLMAPGAEFVASVRYVGGSGINTGRVRGSVFTGNYEAEVAQSEDRILERALDAGRG